MRRKLDRWAALSRDERRLLVGLTVMLPAIGVALRLAGVRQTCRMLLGAGSGTAAEVPLAVEAVHTAKALARLVDIAARHGPYRATCLRRSLALCWLLRRRGLPARLRIGVGLAEGPMSAHAWVDLCGVPIDAHASVSDFYSPFPELGERLSA